MASKRPLMYRAQIVSPEVEPMKRIQHTLTSYELLHLKASPVTILPTPGPGKFYAIFLCAAYYDAGTIPYDLNGNSTITSDPIRWYPFALYLINLLDQPADGINQASPVGYAAPATNFVDQPLTLTVDGPNELLNGDGTLLVVIYYSTESTT